MYYDIINYYTDTYVLYMYNHVFQVSDAHKNQ